ncbi:MAG: hypothetical protein R3195_05245 [Gemmatimonadota bacterium]|nr:hypothetical protein [Gemmatimonadota bacterium]
MSLRRLWTGYGGDLYGSSVSPDGRWVTRIDWTTGNLLVLDLTTGDLHPVTDVRNDEGGSGGWAGRSVFSRDGARVAVSWTAGPAQQLRLVDLVLDDAGTPVAVEAETIFDNPELHPYYPFDWSPDGRHILAGAYGRAGPGGGAQLALISTDGTSRTLKSFATERPLHAAFSPDGRFVAYDAAPGAESADRDLFVLTLDGSYDAAIAPHSAFDRLLGWRADGDILFESDREDVRGVWRVGMVEGRPTGSPELVRENTSEIDPLGLAGDRFYFGVSIDTRRLYTADVDLSTGRLTSSPVTVDDPPRFVISAWDWSSDGRLFAYSGWRDAAEGSEIGVRSPGGEQTFRLDLAPAGRMRWHPDGRSLVVWASSNGWRGFQRIDLADGSASTILRTDGLDEPTWRGDFELSADGGTLYFGRSARFGDPGSLVARDLETGEERVVLRDLTERHGRLAISPDGERLAFVGHESSLGNVVATVPSGGGSVTELSRLIPELTYIWGLEWTPDGRAIVVVASESADLTRQLWVVPASGGEARRIELTDPVGETPRLHRQGSSPLRLHPDGRRVGFLAGWGRSEVWVMEGFHRAATSETEVPR